MPTIAYTWTIGVNPHPTAAHLWQKPVPFRQSTFYLIPPLLHDGQRTGS